MILAQCLLKKYSNKKPFVSPNPPLPEGLLEHLKKAFIFPDSRLFYFALETQLRASKRRIGDQA
jgi:hypothetical protein